MNIEQILALDDAHRETVKIPEWGNVELTLVSMTGVERAEVERRWSKKDASNDPAAFRADVLERTLKNADGTSFATPEQIKQLMGKNAQAVERLFEAGCRVSGMSKQDVKELEGN